MVDFKDYIFGIILTGLVMYSFIFFGVLFATDNDTTVSLIESEGINESFTQLQTNLATIKETASGGRKSFFTGIPVLSEASIIITSIVGVGRVITFDVTELIFVILSNFLGNTFGIKGAGGAVLTSVFMGLFILSTIIILVRFYRTGS